MLSKKQFKQLRGEIVLNSLFMKDYKNSLGIDPQNVIVFFDSYLDYKTNEYEEDHVDATLEEKDNYFYELLEKNDIDDMFNYYSYLEFDALPIEEEL